MTGVETCTCAELWDDRRGDVHVRGAARTWPRRGGEAPPSARSATGRQGVKVIQLPALSRRHAPLRLAPTAGRRWTGRTGQREMIRTVRIRGTKAEGACRQGAVAGGLDSDGDSGILKSGHSAREREGR